MTTAVDLDMQTVPDGDRFRVSRADGKWSSRRYPDLAAAEKAMENDTIRWITPGTVPATGADGTNASVTPDAEPDPEVTPDVGPDPTTEVADEPEAPATDPIERLMLAKLEHEAMKAAIAAGLAKPPTPNLDALHRQYDLRQKGEKPPRAVKVAEAATPPPARDGVTVVPMKSDKHSETITEALADSGLTSAVTGGWFECVDTEAQKVITALSDLASSTDKVYHSRLAAATVVLLRRIYPDTVDSRSGATTKAVRALNKALTSGRIEDWGVIITLDGTLDWQITVDGETTSMRAREVVAQFVAS